MARARGANARMALAIEQTFGFPPATGFGLMAFVSASLGEEQPLIGSIALERVTGGAISGVLARARAPLSAQDEACQKTLDLLRDQQSSAGDARQGTPAVRDETAAMRVDT